MSYLTYSIPYLDTLIFPIQPTLFLKKILWYFLSNQLCSQQRYLGISYLSILHSLTLFGYFRPQQNSIHYKCDIIAFN